MRKIVLLAAIAALAAGCGRRTVYPDGIPQIYHAPLDKALDGSPQRDAWCEMLSELPEPQREGAAYVLANMPRGDVDTMSVELMRENIDYAYRARERFGWCAALSDSIFFNEVLPYTVVDEVRDSWRGELFGLFAPIADTCADMESAARAVNGCIPSVVGVEYNTLREKTNQSPSESMRQHMASCTGLSILLVDALRSVGIPSRFAATAAWHDNRGNHSWTEVLIDGRWRITEYYLPREWDKAWFMADAGQADAEDRMHAIYATSFAPAGDRLPMVWNEESHDVHAENVTRRYRDIYAASEQAMQSDGRHTRLSIVMFRSADRASESADRVAANVDIFCGEEQMGGGRTPSAERDMNDMLTLWLPKNRRYTLLYEGGDGQMHRQHVDLKEEPLTVSLFADE